MDNNVNNNWTVYIHTCIINQKSYVGITSKKPEYRWGYCGNGYKGQAFYDAIQKYGWDNFEHKILYSNLSEKEAKDLEIYLIEKLQTHIYKNGYNVTLGGDGYLGVNNKGSNNPMYGKHHSEKTKQIIREKNIGKIPANLGKHHTEEAKRKMSEHKRPTITGENNYWYGKRHDKMIDAAVKVNSKSVCQFDLNMELVNTYPSAMQAERETNIKHNNISKCCKYKMKTAGGYIWIYESELPKLSELKFSLIDNLINKNKLTLSHKIYQFDLSLNFICEFPSLREAERITGYNHSCISKACKGEFKTFKGYIWKYADDVKDIDTFAKEFNVNLNKTGKSVLQFDKNDNFICEYISCAEAARASNIPRTCISKACLGKQKFAGEYKWKFKDVV